MTEKVLNIFGEEMEACCFDPLTGWKRDGYCNTDDFDHGSHVVCCEVTDAFLAFSKKEVMIYRHRGLNLIFLA